MTFIGSYQWGFAIGVDAFFGQGVYFWSRLPVYTQIGLFFVFWVGLWLPFAIPTAIAVKWQFPRIPNPQQKLPLILSLYVLAPFLLRVISELEQVPFSSYGLTLTMRTGLYTVVGISTGLLGLGLMLGLETSQKWIAWQTEQRPALLMALGPILLLALLVSVAEELVFRGFLVNQLQQAYPVWLTAIAASLLFAILHGVWEGRSVIPQLPGLWLLGMVLILARSVAAGNLGLAIGLHAGWIWGLASLDVSQILHYSNDRPLWLTGFGGNPLAGVLGILLLLLTAAGIWVLSDFTTAF